MWCVIGISFAIKTNSYAIVDNTSYQSMATVK